MSVRRFNAAARCRTRRALRAQAPAGGSHFGCSRPPDQAADVAWTGDSILRTRTRPRRLVGSPAGKPLTPSRRCRAGRGDALPRLAGGARLAAGMIFCQGGANGSTENADGKSVPASRSCRRRGPAGRRGWPSIHGGAFGYELVPRRGGGQRAAGTKKANGGNVYAIDKTAQCGGRHTTGQDAPTK